jgi:hypothetical protein
MNRVKVFIYWNCYDTDSKKMYQFLADWERGFIKKHEAELDTRLHKKTLYFGESDHLYDDMEDCDILLFFTHGEDDAILKRLYEEGNKSNCTLIGLNNMVILAGKKVISICCCSAKALGKASIAAGCKAFVGFQGEICYDIAGSGMNGNMRANIYKTYSSAFEHAIKYAIEKRLTPIRFQSLLKHSILRFLGENLLGDGDTPMPALDLGQYNVADFFISAADSVIALGDLDTPLFAKEKEPAMA